MKKEEKIQTLYKYRITETRVGLIQLLNNIFMKVQKYGNEKINCNLIKKKRLQEKRLL